MLLADPDAKAIAGGQSLLPVMKLRIARPSLLVDIGSLELARDRAIETASFASDRSSPGTSSCGAPVLDAPRVRRDHRMRRDDRRSAGAEPRNRRGESRAR